MGTLSNYVGAEGFGAPEDTGEGYSLIPTEWYQAEITKVEIKDNSKGTGARFIVEFTIIGEKHANRKVWNGAGFNFINASQDCQAIGQRELGRLTKACGFGENERLHDEDELLGKQIDIFVETEAGTGGYQDKNVASKFAPIGQGGKDKPKTAAAPTQARAAVAAPQQQTPSGVQNTTPAVTPTSGVSGKRPWEK